ncbi:magnesium and cobalt transport protein CorA [Cellulomonas fimi]|uniref:Mg2 transporter protein CorA family protein n=1 Tax=Cellulomonas fimi (strain ATCC 484 / DSM 20113 / JCM 1341 / CCUG 24087 / LMG 16345 / NBRC 15513 / NCIMB 8980 / NCTC 7547 / NRS-133) TaxID=590998 RepID=F4GYC1_CELFA|nr:magnesium and cobalt transport protein CorA [Cellulomonas fimi]AEE45910.1 Mg2 transporter protein CorA family protein [Cellulomonas fimi ATCC 484]NNH06763.1 magnesium and cobalt transport protein CorA [Cellulomonas fimi]VEH30970.1 Magnesium transport protein CorA [Cellulomonas fimi]
MDERADAVTGTDETTRTIGGGATWVVVRDAVDLPGAARRHGVGEDACAVLRLRGAGAHPPTPDHPVRARIDRTPDGTLVVTTPTLSYDPASRQVSTGALSLLVGHDVVLTAESGGADVLGRTAERLAAGPPVPDEGVRQVLALALLALVASAADVEIELGDAVAATEAEVFSTTSGDPVQRIYDLKREIAEARRALGPVTSVLPELVADAGDEPGGERTQRWLRRVQASVDRVDQHLDAHDDLLGDMLSAHLSRVSVRQNEDMRKISAWAAIAAVPTLVAGVYGMNFEHMPELTWHYGYPAALLGMTAVCVVLYRLFRRSGWL